MIDYRYRINGFDQIKSFYSWLFNNQDKEINTSHVSLYLFLINQNNRSNWVEWFKCPYDLGMAGSCIGSRNTYYKCLADLQGWGLIEYKKGTNNYKSPVIKLCLFKNEHLIEQVPVPLSEPLTEQVPIPLTEHLTEHIYKLLTDNIKLITDNLEEVISFLNSKSDKSQHEEHKKLKAMFEIFRQNYPGTKRGFDSEFENLKKKHKNWKEIVPLLSDALNYQHSAREIKRMAGGFVPEWKNLQTWINQKCWEEEILTNNISNEVISRNNKGGATPEQLRDLIVRTEAVGR